MLFRRKLPRVSEVPKYSSQQVAELANDFEIEIRRLIIEYQQGLLLPTPWEQIEKPASAHKESRTSEPSPAPAATPQCAEEPLPSVEELDKILPLPEKHKKKSLSEFLDEITIEEVISETPDEELLKPVAFASEPDEPRASATTDNPAQLPKPETFQEKLLDYKLRRLDYKIRKFEESAARKLEKDYYKSLEFQIYCNTAPLFELLNYIHDRYGI